MAERKAIFPAGRADIYQKNGYSAAIHSGDFLFVSGQVGSQENGAPVAEPGRQIEQAFANLADVLKAAGCGFDDIVDVMTFHVDPEAHVEVFFKAKQKIFGQPPYPNWTAIGVTWLSGFMFEIKVVARIPGGDSHE